MKQAFADEPWNLSSRPHDGRLVTKIRSSSDRFDFMTAMEGYGKGGDEIPRRHRAVDRVAWSLRGTPSRVVGDHRGAVPIPLYAYL